MAYNFGYIHSSLSMNRTNGFGAIGIIIAIALLAALGGGAYVATHHTPVSAPETATTTAATATAQAADDASTTGKLRVDWKFTDAGEKDHIPYTTVSFNDQVVGTYEGACAEIGASGGIDGKGLLAGELSGVQCYFAGGGDEIGLFANEDGGTEIMVGNLEEPIEGGAGFRGDFKIRTDIKL